jgi:hypothetical protein
LLPIIAIIASIAIPNLLAARLNANESAAIATLKNISSGQAQCQASGAIDANGNGQGEYGFFAELSGKVTVRGSTLTISPPVLSTAFGNITAQSTVARSGYLFKMFLPDPTPAGLHRSGDGRWWRGHARGRREPVRDALVLLRLAAGAGQLGQALVLHQPEW